MAKSDSRPLIAEAVGTFVLALAVGSSGHTTVPTPLVAGLTLMMLVYVLGPVSGAHVNPAVTLGLWSAGAVKPPQALRYIVAQLIGGAVALLLLRQWSGLPSPEAVLMPGSVGEALGALLLVLGVTTTVRGKVPAEAAGLAVGGSLFVGVLAASSMSPGVLNPAVALGVGAVSADPMSWLVYLLMPIVGGLLGGRLATSLLK